MLPYAVMCCMGTYDVTFWMFRVAVGCKLLLYAVTWHQILLSVALCYWLVSPDVAWCCWSLHVCVCSCMLLLDAILCSDVLNGDIRCHLLKSWVISWTVLLIDVASCTGMLQVVTSSSGMFKLLMNDDPWHQLLLSVALCCWLVSADIRWCWTAWVCVHVCCC